MNLFKCAFKSVLSRKVSIGLLILSIGLSTMMLVGINKVTNSVKESFSNSVSGTDLIVGARTGDLQLLLYSIFHIGMPSKSMKWESYEFLDKHPDVQWTIPLSLGDSHRGYPVVATTESFFKYYLYSQKEPLTFNSGTAFQKRLDVVLGSDVASSIGYSVGSSLYLTHGFTDHVAAVHDDKTFNVVGVLNKTGTPVDKSLFISLAAMAHLHAYEHEDYDHVDDEDGHGDHDEHGHDNHDEHGHDDHDDHGHDDHDEHGHDDHDDHGHDDHDEHGHEDMVHHEHGDRDISAVLIGTKNKFSIFNLKNEINDYRYEALSAILPGLSLLQLWETISNVEVVFQITAVIVVVIALLGLLLAMFMSINQRQREISILRTIGAHPFDILMLILYECLLVTVSGVLLGLLLTVIFINGLKPWLEAKVGVHINSILITTQEINLCFLIIGAGILVGFIPAFIAYRRSLSESIKDGL